MRRFLNFPGFHDGAYIVAYVEDTRPRRISPPRSPRAFSTDPIPHARTILEIADCSNRINLDFSLHRELHVLNSLHKVDCLLTALTEFRQGLVEEAALYEQRKRSLAGRSKRPAQGRTSPRRH